MGYNLIYKIKVISSLGLENSFYAGWYKFKSKYRLKLTTTSHSEISNSTPIFLPVSTPNKIDIDSDDLFLEADTIVDGSLKYFNNNFRKSGNPPDWFLNPFNNVRFPRKLEHWQSVSDFNSGVGDIKCVWEASRFDWALVLARAYIQSENIRYLDTLNSFVKNWIEKNPVNFGPNWKCGQEASFRCFNLILAWVVLGRPETGDVFNSFLQAHAQRIESNIKYALCQDNNHGTSEASALYLIGLILKKQKYSIPDAERWHEEGRIYLEKLVLRLIQDDGSFSQNSINYHRVLLDTLNTVEAIRASENDNKFSDEFYIECKQATDWLNQFVDDESGNVPNLGANDGALICKLNSCSFSDYRPTLQFSNTLFNSKRVFVDGPWNEALHWFGLTGEFETIKKVSKIFPAGGYAVIRHENASLFFRAPRFNFRPAQADAMHLDLWLGKENLLIDSGTFSYNDLAGIGDVVKSAKGHNTIVFDNADPMPKLGTFLYGEWLNGKFEFSEDSIIASYKDYRGCVYVRNVKKTEDGFTVFDEIQGNFKTAELYWHLGRQEWKLIGNNLSCPEVSIEIIANCASEPEIVLFPRSEFYQQYTMAQCCKVSFDENIKNVETIIRFN